MDGIRANTRLSAMEQSPDLVKKLQEFSVAISGSGCVDALILLLVDIRASQINGCAFCVDMHVKEAKLHGERELRLYHVAVWRESHLFSNKERAALAWTEALTKIDSKGISDEIYHKVREQFNEKELSILTFRIMGINAWNRLNVAFHATPGAHDKFLGLDKAGLA